MADVVMVSEGAYLVNGRVEVDQDGKIRSASHQSLNPQVGTVIEAVGGTSVDIGLSSVGLLGVSQLDGLYRNHPLVWTSDYSPDQFPVGLSKAIFHEEPSKMFDIPKEDDEDVIGAARQILSEKRDEVKKRLLETTLRVKRASLIGEPEEGILVETGELRAPEGSRVLMLRKYLEGLNEEQLDAVMHVIGMLGIGIGEDDQ